MSTAPRYLITLLVLITLSNNAHADVDIVGVGLWAATSAAPCPNVRNQAFAFSTHEEADAACEAEDPTNYSQFDSINTSGAIYLCLLTSTNTGCGFFGYNYGCFAINGHPAISQDASQNICTYSDTVCPTGQTYNVNTSQCEIPMPCTAGGSQEFFGPSQSLALGSTIDICGSDLCIYTATEDFQFLSGPSAGTSQYNGTATGASCSSADNFSNAGAGTPDVPEPDTQPQNGCIESSSGEVWCTSDQTNSPPLPDNGTPGTPAQPDGQQNNQTTNTTNNFFNESTTNNSSNFGTTPGSTGGTTGSDGESDPSFGDIDTDGDGTGDCDPSTEDCGTSSVSGGATCASFPQCDGDPIQCAIRKQAWFTRCNLESNVEDITESDVMTQLGQTQTIEEYFDPANNLDNEVDVMSEVTLPTPDAGACPADLTMSLSTGPFTFPSQPICDVASLVRPAILALAYLISALMFYNGLVRDF